MGEVMVFDVVCKFDVGEEVFMFVLCCKFFCFEMVGCVVDCVV